MYIDELLRPGELREQLALGNVTERYHKDYPLAILNYTAQCQWENAWNDVTRKTRGLIYNTNTGRVLARPFEKFFNLSQHTDDEIPNLPMRVLEKMDGSLGILYGTPDGLAIATRGSFHSEQAEHGTAVLQKLLSQFAESGVSFDPVENLTYLFEIIYPANRIVVDYGAMDTLVLLDIIDNESGMSVKNEIPGAFPGINVQEFPGIETLGQLLAEDERPNAEGFVVIFDNGFRVKVKHEEYVRLHRILTNVTARYIYEVIAIEDLKERGYDDGTIARSLRMAEAEVVSYPTLVKVLEGVPDEFYTWVHKTVHRLEGQFAILEAELGNEFRRIMEQVSG